MVERAVQLVDRAGTKSVANVGAVEGNAYDRHIRALGAAVCLGAARNTAVVGDVGKVEALDLAPARRVEGVGDEGESAHMSDFSGRGRGGLPAPGRVSRWLGEEGVSNRVGRLRGCVSFPVAS